MCRDFRDRAPVPQGDPAFYGWYAKAVLRHLLTYTPETAARHLHTPIPVVEEFVAWQLRREGRMNDVAKAKSAPNFWNGFANLRLTDAQKQAFAHWDMETDDCWELLLSRLLSGYKLSFTYNAANKTFTAALTCNEKKDPNAGYTLTAYAPDTTTALRLLAFKDEILADGGEWPKESEERTGGIG